MLFLMAFALTGSGCWKSDEELAERVKPSVVEEKNKEKEKPAARPEKEIAGEQDVKETVEDIPEIGETAEPAKVVEEDAETVEAREPVETGGMTEAELWTAYNLAKTRLETAKETNHFEGMVGSLLDAAACAEALNRPDIAVWQYNNIGFYAIVEFKRLTEYQERMDALQGMPAGETKKRYLEETRALILQNMNLLERGLRYLQKAEDMESELNNSERREKIESNIRFIRWVQSFAEAA
jgi:hypothetical protein